MTSTSESIPQAPEPLAYSIKDAVQVSGIGRSRIYELIRDGQLEMRKVGHRSLIPAHSLRRLVG
jgi:excisionase family DNA binding protein